MLVVNIFYFSENIFQKAFFFLTFIKICDYSAKGYIGIMYYRDTSNPDFLRAKQSFSFDVKLEKMGERRKCWLSTSFTLSKIFSKMLFFFLTFIKICDYSANGYIGIMYYRDAPNPDFLRAKQPFSFDVKLEKMGERRKCWLSTFSTFPKIFSKMLFFFLWRSLKFAIIRQMVILV